MRRIRIIALLLALASITMLLAACGDTEEHKAYDSVADAAAARKPYIPKNAVEFNNYNRAQQLYDDPTTIIWCSVYPQSATTPVVTVPVAGKLTSSSTSYFSPDHVTDDGIMQARSVDGLYHPNPPQYRYGFTPGGQYVDFFNLPTFCTTKPLAIQSRSVSVKVDSKLNAATQKAQEALSHGDNAEAQRLLQAAAGE